MIEAVASLVEQRKSRQTPPPAFGGSYSKLISNRAPDPVMSEQLKAYIHFTYAAIRARATRVSELNLQLFEIEGAEEDADRLTGSQVARRRQQCINWDGRVGSKMKREFDSFQRAETNITEVRQHPFLDVLAHPNSQHERTEILLKEKLEIQLCLTGNHFWLLRENNGGELAEIWTLRPDRMTALCDINGYLQTWCYMRDDGQPVYFPPEEIVHFKHASPTDDIFGWSMIKAAAYAHDTQTFMNTYHRNFFENSARPDFVLVSELPISKEEATRALEQWKGEFGGYRRAHLPAILGQGLTPKALQLTNTDIQFLGLANWNLDQLVAVTGVPRAKLGLVADSNRSNSEAADATFNKETIRPEMLKVVEQIQVDILRRYYDTDTVKYDVGFPDPVAGDREFELNRRIEEFKGGIRTLNEARESADLEPFPDELGDRIKIQMQDILIPVGDSGPILDIAIGTATGQTGPADDDDAPPVTEASAPAHIRASTMDTMFGNSEFRDLWWGRFAIRATRGEAQFLKYFEAAFKEQERLVKKAAKEVLGVRQGEDSPTIDRILRLSMGPEMDAKMAAAVERMAYDLIIAEGEFLISTLGLEDISITAPIRVRGINEVTRQTLREVMQRWATAGGTLAELTDEITDTFGFAPARAANIARTQATGALNAGTAAVIDAARIPYKEWLSRRDGKVRDTHRAADGQVVRANGTFQVGNARLRYPGDPYTGDADEVAGCRCTHVPRMTPPS
jgi:HK97 family phage portal protein